jgi:hypothetical protein
MTEKWWFGWVAYIAMYAIPYGLFVLGAWLTN